MRKKPKVFGTEAGEERAAREVADEVSVSLPRSGEGGDAIKVSM
jgi:hypothetical protein